MAFEVYEELKSRQSLDRPLTDYNTINMPEMILDDEISSTADYSVDIHHYLNHLHEILMETIRHQPSALQENQTNENEF